MPQEEIGTREAATLLGLSVQRVRSMHHRGTLKTGRRYFGALLFQKSEVLELKSKRDAA
jgi:hypothetical protein